jgi:predicted NBD/HSP70 family sugar kinase
MLVLDGEPYAAVGMEVDADTLTVVALDLAGTQLLSWRRAFVGVDSPPGRSVSAIATLASRAVNRVIAQNRQVLGLTVGVPGLVDAGGAVTFAANLGWHGVDLRAELVRALRDPGFEVSVDNDANLAALAEQRYGAYAGTANLVAIRAGVGVGAGILVDGHVLRGGRGFTGEIGHVQVDPTGPVCRCGRTGCLEAVAGVAAIVRRVLPETEADGPVVDYAPEVEEVLRRVRQADPVAIEALAAAGRHLGHGVAILANLVNPDVVVVGGTLAPLAPWLLPHAESELRARSVAPDSGGCRLVASALDGSATAIGGAARALAAVDAGHLPRMPAAVATG